MTNPLRDVLSRAKTERETEDAGKGNSIVLLVAPPEEPRAADEHMWRGGDVGG